MLSSSELQIVCRHLNYPSRLILDSDVVAWLATHLNKQKRGDFKPRNDDLSFARVNTEPCEACCETLEKARDVAKQSLTGRNLEVFLTEVGVTFHTCVKECAVF
jgi:exocyst complex component 5